ncbi:MAG: MFS transporter [Clostridiales bacterium]|nr:MFS transporter [Clostridiales bacterium]
MKTTNKIKRFIGDFKEHWSTPYSGRYIPNKEIVAYGVGGMGVHFAVTITGCFTLSSTNFFVGSCIGLQPMHLQYMLIIANIVGLLITSVRSYCFDNTKSPDGKFRPYLKWMGIPTVIVSIIFVWLPYETMDYTTKVIVVEIMYLLVNCFSPFYSEAFSTLLQVMSPDSDERTDVMSISQIIYSLAPSLTNLLIPFLAQLTGGLTDIRTYRFIYPAISVLGLFMAFPVYKYTNERIIKPRSLENEIRFFDAIRSIAKNKYYWIINIAGWIGFAESAYSVILNWTFVYGHPEQEELLGVAQTVIGNGALWSMMAAPFFIRLIGKRNLLIWCNLANVVLLALLYPFYDNIWIVIVIFYINNFVAVLGNIYNPGIQADMKDYQQYITGERIDGMFGVVGMIGTVLGFGTGLIVPYLQEICGLKDDYDVLYDSAVRGHLFQVMIIASVIGAILNVIPFFFYDLTEKKQKGITYVLRIRSMFDDYASGNLSDSTLITGMEIIHTAAELKDAEPIKITKDELKLAKQMPKNTKEEKELRTQKISQAKTKIKEQKKHNLDIELSPIVNKEMDKFSTERYIMQLETAKFILSYSYADLDEIVFKLTDKAKSAPKNTKQEKEIRSDLFTQKRIAKNANKLCRKYYPNGIIEPDSDALNKAQELPNNTPSQALKRKLAVRRVLKEKSVYKRAVKPFTDANKLLIEKESYQSMDELEMLYTAAKERTAFETATAKA